MAIEEVRREPQPLTHDQIWGEAGQAPELGCTCLDCHAPVAVGCVTIVWVAKDGGHVPPFQPRRPHSKRRKLFEKFGPPSDAPVRALTAQDKERIAAKHRELHRG